MEYIKLGNSDLNVSRICMGCMGFGDPTQGPCTWTINEEQSREIIKRGLELGVNFFDTAIAYQSGTSEQYVGRALRSLAKREDVIVATKFLPRTADEIAAGISGQQHVERMLNKSLENLGMDYVDLYICHMWDYNTPIEEIMEGMNNAVKAGKVRAIGISMVPLCEEDNIALTPYSSLAGGRLSKRQGETSKRQEEDGVAKMKYDATAEQDGIIIARVAELADRYGVTMTQVALAWLLQKVASPVVGATKLHHIEGAVTALDLKLTPDDMAYLEEMYIPHKLVGVMALNKKKPTEKATWSTGNQVIK